MLAELLNPQRIELDADISSKKKALQELSRLSADSNSALNANLVFDALTDREKLGSTALEKGIAIPHCRITDCTRPLLAVLTLGMGIDFDARDDQPVDLICALIVPEQSTEEHLNILSALAGMLSNSDNCHRIRGCSDANQLLAFITELETNSPAYSDH